MTKTTSAVQVYQALDKQGKVYALKIVDVSEGEKYFKEECSLLAKAKHANIMKFFQAFTDTICGKKYGFIVTELADGKASFQYLPCTLTLPSCKCFGSGIFKSVFLMMSGYMKHIYLSISQGTAQESLAQGIILILVYATAGSLSEPLRAGQHVTFSFAQDITAQLLAALDHLHERRIVHADLKPANILYFGEQGEDGVKLCDFGLATKLHPFQATYYPGCCGTYYFMAPEQFKGSLDCSVSFLPSPAFLQCHVCMPQTQHSILAHDAVMRLLGVFAVRL